jgi:hypothetical protein
MKLPRRTFLHLAAGAAALPAVSGIARAQTYPTRPITMIVPFAAGGPTDVLGRILAERMRAALGQTVIVENSTGAGGGLLAVLFVRVHELDDVMQLVQCSQRFFASSCDRAPAFFQAETPDSAELGGRDDQRAARAKNVIAFKRAISSKDVKITSEKAKAGKRKN